MVRLLLGLVGLTALGGVLLFAGCDSFPAACETRDDCAEGELCQDGECLAVEPSLLVQCQDADEICNFRDDDCDGTTDEGCAGGDDCFAGFGICVRMGVLTESSQGLLCSADPGPPGDELCNGLDDDCDGAVDEICPPGSLCFVGIGQCRSDGRTAMRDGLRVCVDDNADAVQPGEPSDEVCGDRVDNDCDGAIDEGFAEQLGGVCEEGLGECAVAGVFVCVDGAVRCSARPGVADIELCDRRDNDCDGTADEDFGTGEACTAGIGACQSSGMVICNGTQDGSVCNAVQRPASDEDCDGVDDDCDGTVDEGQGGAPLTRACGQDVGECRAGTETCIDAVWGACEGEVTPVAESCNGRDDDCDGTDDQFDRPCGSNTGACSAGTERCVDGIWGACLDSIPPRAETCDGTDDDCDDVIDEAHDTGVAGSYAEPCGLTDVGECSFGVRSCVDGVLAACGGEIQPVNERCDGLDNDCDGSSDEGYNFLGERCAVNLGDCSLSGVYICRADGSGTVCDVEVEPPPELCNDEDDDCDGRVDEGLQRGAACLDNQARAGVCGCVPADAVACLVDLGAGPMPQVPTERSEDGVDNDCDGEVDER